MRDAIARFTRNGGNLFISGAYIGTDMVENNDSLCYSLCLGHIALYLENPSCHHARFGICHGSGSTVISSNSCSFNTGYHPDIYRVESPDAIEPSGEGAFRIYRYASGNCSAGIAYKGSYRTVALGFPFETLLTDEQRTELMMRIMNFFKYQMNHGPKE